MHKQCLPVGTDTGRILVILLCFGLCGFDFFFFIPFSFGRKGEELCPRKCQDLLSCLKGHAFLLSHPELARVQQKSQSWKQPKRSWLKPSRWIFFSFFDFYKLPSYSSMVSFQKRLRTFNARTFPLDKT